MRKYVSVSGTDYLIGEYYIILVVGILFYPFIDLAIIIISLVF